ncbi:hypothetical protein XH94_06200 [Bradyrhizobium zhanjiangense]|uniref:Uncharacterized protein n=1 Tax=Bradyrhizobium zhanjiangense TaxID=1325107 RepID=A0A4Q0SU63_9BRAD|nr:hypothetical protein XH94_06200 [Bradyrhizobium zhanjiangense]
MNLAEYRRSNTRLGDFLPWAALVDEGIRTNCRRASIGTSSRMLKSWSKRPRSRSRIQPS